MNILIINGPNLNMLGIRETSIYGSKTYTDLVEYLKKLELKYKINLKIFQSNFEGAIIEELHKAFFEKFDAIIINPAAFTHYSYAIYDAIKSINIKTIEVHLSDIYNRQEFRKNNVIKAACINSFYGKGFESYKDAIEYLVGVINEIS